MADLCPRCGSKLRVRILPYMDNARIEECDNCGWPAASSGSFGNPTMMMDLRKEGKGRGGFREHLPAITATGLGYIIIGFIFFIAPLDPLFKFGFFCVFTVISFIPYFAGSMLSGLTLLFFTIVIFFGSPLGQFVLDKSGASPVTNEATLYLTKWLPCVITNGFKNPYLNPLQYCENLIHPIPIVQTGCSDCLAVTPLFFSSSGSNAKIKIDLQMDSRATRPATNVWLEVSYWNDTRSETTSCGVFCSVTNITKVRIYYPP